MKTIWVGVDADWNEQKRKWEYRSIREFNLEPRLAVFPYRIFFMPKEIDRIQSSYVHISLLADRLKPGNLYRYEQRGLNLICTGEWTYLY